MNGGGQRVSRACLRWKSVRRARRCSTPTSRRGFTLLEILVAIGMVVAMGLLVFPVMSSRLAERSFVSIAEQIESQLLLARAEAMNSRRALEVRYDSGRSRITVHEFLAGSVAISAGDRDLAVRKGNTGDDLLGSFYGDQDEAVLVTAAAWGSLRVPAEMSLLDELPDRIDEELGAGDRLDLSTDQLASLDGQSYLDSELDPTTGLIRLAVFLSDGSALISRPTWLLDQDGRRVQIEINPWTGLPQLHRTSTRRPDEGELETDEYDVDDGEELAGRDANLSAETQPTSPASGGGP